MLPQETQIKQAPANAQVRHWPKGSVTCLKNWSKRQDLSMLLDQIPAEKPITRILIAGACSTLMIEHIRRRFPFARVCWLQDKWEGKASAFGDLLYTFQGSPDELPRSSKFQLIFRFHFSVQYPVSSLYPFLEDGGYLLLRQRIELIRKPQALGYTGLHVEETQYSPTEQVEETLQKLCAEVMYSGPNPSWPARLAFVISRNTRNHVWISWAGVFITELLEGLDELLRQSVSRYQDRIVRKPSIYRS